MEYRTETEDRLRQALACIANRDIPLSSDFSEAVCMSKFAASALSSTPLGVATATRLNHVLKAIDWMRTHDPQLVASAEEKFGALG